MKPDGAAGGTEQPSGCAGDKERPPLLRFGGGFGADTSKLAAGAALGQAATFLAMPLITRLFSPDALGVLAGFASIGTVLLVVVCLRYEQTIMLPRRDEAAAVAVVLSLLSASVVVGLSATVVSLGEEERLLSRLGLSELAPFIWMMVPWLAASAGLLVLNEWNFRLRRFGLAAGGAAAASLTTNVLCVAAGLAGHATAGTLIKATVAGALVALAVQVAFTIKAGRLPPSFRLTDVSHVLRGYISQPLYNTPATLLGVVSWQLPVFMLAAFFSPAVAAQYALGNRVIQMPMTLAGGAIGKVFFQRAAEALQTDRLAPLVEVTFRRLVALGLPPTLLFLLAGEELFGWAFGADWVEAGRYVQILSLWGFIWFIAAPLSYLHLIHRKQRFFFVWSLASFAARLLSLFVGGVFGSALLAVSLFGFSGVMIYGFLLRYLLELSGVAAWRALQIMTSSALCSLPVILAVLLCDAAEAPPWLGVGIQGPLVVVYLLLVFRNERLVRQGSASLVRVVKFWFRRRKEG